MDIKIKLTILFDGQFWVGVFERGYDGLYETSKVVFGPEPKDYDVHNFVLQSYNHLKYSKPIIDEEKTEKKINPKRLHRQIRNETTDISIGTKAQRAMKLEQETRKIERKKISKEKKEELKNIKYSKRQAKRKEKKRGH